MKIGVFGGSFDPIQKEHKKIAKSAIEELGLDKLIVMPAGVSPFKENKLLASGEDRLNMLRLAFNDVEKVEISFFELNAKGTSYTYLTMQDIGRQYPDAELFLIFGEDCLRSFEFWKNPQEITKLANLVAFIRTDKKNKRVLNYRTKSFYAECKRVSEKFAVDVIPMHYVSDAISSTDVRLASCFSRELEDYVDDEIAEYIYARKLYTVSKVSKAMSFIKKSRQTHTYNVTKLAVKYASQYKLSEEKIILACGMHDVAKYLKADSEELEGFPFEEYSNVPEPVLHQYTGEYVAREILGETDKDVLNAIRYHTSGNANMSTLSKLIFLCDMLEEGRDFRGVKKLRKLLDKDLNLCLMESLKHQIKYLKNRKSTIYPLTLEAYEYIKDEIKGR